MIILFHYFYKLNYFHESEKIIKNLNSQPTSAQTHENPFMKIVQQKQQQDQLQQNISPFFQQDQQQRPQSFMNQPAFGSSSNFFQQQPVQPQIQNPFSQIASIPIQQPMQQTPLFNLKTNQQVVNPPITMVPGAGSNFFSQIVNMNTSSVQQMDNTFLGRTLPTSTITNTNSSYYSKLNELNSQDLDEFKSNQFTIGRIPQIPPPIELC